ncbi:MAG: nuclear transport factor 2 family protein [Cyclobacteriaceae bacterium]
MKNKQSLTIAVIFLLVISNEVRSQSKVGRDGAMNFAAYSAQFMDSFEARDLDRFVSFYDDSVLYRDPAYGSSDVFSNAQLRRMFNGLLSPTGGWKFKVLTEAPDAKRETLMVLIDVTDPEGVNNEYAGWFRFKNGKIVEQIDFTTYPVDVMLTTPRYKKYFEDKKLEIKPTSGGK